LFAVPLENFGAGRPTTINKYILVMNDYRFTQEYLDRFGLNKADLYLIDVALQVYTKQANKEIDEAEAKGNRSIFGKSFFEQRREDILMKLEMWLKPELVYEEE